MRRLLLCAALTPRARALSGPSSSSAARKALEAHAAFVKTKTPAALAAARDAHNARQRAVFDDAAAYFASPDASPPDVEAVLEALAARVVRAAAPDDPARARVLDVGCGTGCLSRKYGGEVVGVDLSPEMVAAAAAGGGTNVTYVCADVVDYAATGWDFARPFDAVVFNACFGNVYDQGAALEAAAAVLKPGGVCCVTHPLGSAFVDRLRDEDASVVPHGLPKTPAAMRRLLGDETFLEPATVDDGAPFYAAFRRRPYARLARPLGLRGPVARGYGRGSKQLGVPTANLPEDLFGDALADVPPGVYAAWVWVDDAVRPAVVNVGYSPTFAGAENALKIVEAHVLDYAAAADFYDRTLAVVLVAFQRPERKFADFPSLLANIQNDIRVAADALRDDADLSALRDVAVDFLVDGPVATRAFEPGPYAMR